VSSEHKRFRLSWSKEVKGAVQKAGSTIGSRIMVGTLGTYPCFGFKNALTIPVANSRQVGETERA